MVGFHNNNTDKYDLGQIPSIPHVLLQLIEACHKADVSFGELSEIVQRDVGLSAKTLAAAGALTDGRVGGVAELDQLIPALGVDALRTIAITTAVNHFFSPFDEMAGRRVGRLWRDSLCCAHGARLLARVVGYARPEEAYLAGLLFQTGALLLHRQAPGQYEELLREEQSDETLSDSEIALFGTTVGQLGAHMIRQWGGAPMLVDTVRFQREPVDALLDAPRLLRLVSLSRRLIAVTEPDEMLALQAEQLLGVSPDELKGVVAGMHEAVSQTAEELGVSLDWQCEIEQDFSADSEEVRLGLARKVREFALLDGVQRHVAGGGESEDVLRAALQDFGMLFGVGSGVCFLCEANGESLTAVAGNCADEAQIGEFRLKLKPDRSLAAESVMSRRVVSTFESGFERRLTVADRQMVEMLGEEGMVCVPLFTGANDIGVIVMGASRVDVHRLTREAEFLRCFSETVAGALNQRQQLFRSREEALQQERELKQGQIRKLVHEANNPLAIIKNYLQVLSIRLGDESGVQDQLSILNEEIERVAGIIMRMRDITPTTDVTQGAVDVNELIRDLLGVFRVSHFVSGEIQADIRLADSIPPILTNRNSLKQILTNLIKNAVEAMPDGGALGLSSRDRVNVDGAQYIELRLTDTGPGIPAEVLDNIFHPVRSTKGGGHSGLGLTIVKNLLSDINGSISCSNGAESGAEFVLHLPRNLEKQ